MDVILKLLRESLPEAIGGLITLAIVNAIGWLWAKRSKLPEELPSEPATQPQPQVEPAAKPARKSTWPIFSLGILGILVVYISFKFAGGLVGWGSLLILLGVLVTLSPLKYRRFLIAQCLVLINGLFAGTQIYSILATNEVVVASIESNYFLNLFLGGPLDKALLAAIFGLALGGLSVILPLLAVMYISSELLLAMRNFSTCAINLRQRN